MISNLLDKSEAEKFSSYLLAYLVDRMQPMQIYYTIQSFSLMTRELIPRGVPEFLEPFAIYRAMAFH
jgi:3-deoxy-D-manno-octulosonic-acid transferase